MAVMNLIKRLLVKKGWRQKQLAAAMGTSESRLSNIITGRTEITVERAAQLGNIFDVDTALFLKKSATAIQTEYNLNIVPVIGQISCQNIAHHDKSGYVGAIQRVAYAPRDGAREWDYVALVCTEPDFIIKISGDSRIKRLYAICIDSKTMPEPINQGHTVFEKVIEGKWVHYNICKKIPLPDLGLVMVGVQANY